MDENSYPYAQERRMIIMQGKPGCGKSTVAEAIEYFLSDTEPDDGSRRPVSSSLVVSSDRYLYDGDKYVYTPGRQAAAHERAQKEAFEAMAKGTELVVIDNTNLKPEWAEFYFRAAHLYRYSVQVIRVDAQWHLQKAQNDSRPEDRKVPLEFYEDVIPQDLLRPPSSYSRSACFWEAWRWFRSLFLPRGSRIEITGSSEPTPLKS